MRFIFRLHLVHHASDLQKILHFAFTPSKHGLKRAIGQEMSTHDLFSIYRWQQFLFRLPCIDLICELGYMMEQEINGVFGLLTDIIWHFVFPVYL